MIKEKTLEGKINLLEQEVEDGFDDAYVDGWRHILKESGDGGLSEIYFQGLMDAMKFKQENKIYN